MSLFCVPGEGWACGFCGDFGRLPPGETVDTYLCPTCGEMVLPAQ